jgi:hypothetical protein
MMGRKTSLFNVVSVALGLAFLYLPIVILVIYSFNASRLVTVWGGWSLAWYRELPRCRRAPPPCSAPAPPSRSRGWAASAAACCFQVWSMRRW